MKRNKTFREMFDKLKGALDGEEGYMQKRGTLIV